MRATTSSSHYSPMVDQDKRNAVNSSSKVRTLRDMLIDTADQVQGRLLLADQILKALLSAGDGVSAFEGEGGGTDSSPWTLAKRGLASFRTPLVSTSSTVVKPPPMLEMKKGGDHFDTQSFASSSSNNGGNALIVSGSMGSPLSPYVTERAALANFQQMLGQYQQVFATALQDVELILHDFVTLLPMESRQEEYLLMRLLSQACYSQAVVHNEPKKKQNNESLQQSDRVENTSAAPSVSGNRRVEEISGPVPMVVTQRSLKSANIPTKGNDEQISPTIVAGNHNADEGEEEEEQEEHVIVERWTLQGAQQQMLEQSVQLRHLKTLLRFARAKVKRRDAVLQYIQETIYKEMLYFKEQFLMLSGQITHEKKDDLETGVFSFLDFIHMLELNDVEDDSDNDEDLDFDCYVENYGKKFGGAVGNSGDGGRGLRFPSSTEKRIREENLHHLHSDAKFTMSDHTSTLFSKLVAQLKSQDRLRRGISASSLLQEHEEGEEVTMTALESMQKQCLALEKNLKNMSSRFVDEVTKHKVSKMDMEKQMVRTQHDLSFALKQIDALNEKIDEKDQELLELDTRCIELTSLVELERLNTSAENATAGEAIASQSSKLAQEKRRMQRLLDKLSLQGVDVLTMLAEADKEGEDPELEDHLKGMRDLSQLQDQLKSNEAELRELRAENKEIREKIEDRNHALDEVVKYFYVKGVRMPEKLQVYFSERADHDAIYEASLSMTMIAHEEEDELEKFKVESESLKSMSNDTNTKISALQTELIDSLEQRDHEDAKRLGTGFAKQKGGEQSVNIESNKHQSQQEGHVVDIEEPEDEDEDSVRNINKRTAKMCEDAEQLHSRVRDRLAKDSLSISKLDQQIKTEEKAKVEVEKKLDRRQFELDEAQRQIVEMDEELQECKTFMSTVQNKRFAYVLTQTEIQGKGIEELQLAKKECGDWKQTAEVTGVKLSGVLEDNQFLEKQMEEINIKLLEALKQKQEAESLSLKAMKQLQQAQSTNLNSSSKSGSGSQKTGGRKQDDEERGKMSPSKKHGSHHHGGDEEDNLIETSTFGCQVTPERIRATFHLPEEEEEGENEKQKLAMDVKALSITAGQNSNEAVKCQKCGALVTSLSPPSTASRRLSTSSPKKESPDVGKAKVILVDSKATQTVHQSVMDKRKGGPPTKATQTTLDIEELLREHPPKVWSAKAVQVKPETKGISIMTEVAGKDFASNALPFAEETALAQEGGGVYRFVKNRGDVPGVVAVVDCAIQATMTLEAEDPVMDHIGPSQRHLVGAGGGIRSAGVRTTNSSHHSSSLLDDDDDEEVDWNPEAPLLEDATADLRKVLQKALGGKGNKPSTTKSGGAASLARQRSALPLPRPTSTAAASLVAKLRREACGSAPFKRSCSPPFPMFHHNFPATDVESIPTHPDVNAELLTHQFQHDFGIRSLKEYRQQMREVRQQFTSPLPEVLLLQQEAKKTPPPQPVVERLLGSAQHHICDPLLLLNGSASNTNSSIKTTASKLHHAQQHLSSVGRPVTSIGAPRRESLSSLFIEGEKKAMSSSF